MAEWISRDHWNATDRDRSALVAYLKDHRITPVRLGYLDAMLHVHDTGWDAWRYLSYAAQTYPTHQSVQRNLKELSKKGRDTSSDIFQHRRYESGWKAALLEFRALYALTRFFGYQFVDFDGKASSVSGNDDCDLVLSRSGNRTKFVYAEVKCWCFPERSQVPDPACSILRRYNSDNLDVGYLKDYCDRVLPGKLKWRSDGPIWCDGPLTTVEQIAIVWRSGCWLVRLSRPLTHQTEQTDVVIDP